MATDIFWSEKSERFHSGASGRIVSNDTGIRNLLYDEDASQFIDSRGRTVPADVLTRTSFRSRDQLGYDNDGRPFVVSTIRSRSISDIDAANLRIDPNQSVMVRTVVTLPDGKTYISYAPGKQGENVDPEAALARAAAKVRAELGSAKNSTGRTYDISTNEIRNRTQSSEFILQTVAIR